MRKATLAALTGFALVLAGPAGAQQVHVVRPGENLTELSKRYGVSISRLRDTNGLRDPDLVRIGQRLRIPAVPAPAGGTTTHRVAPGETLSHIAVRYGTTVGALAVTNGISDPHLVWAGRRIVVPLGYRPAVSRGRMPKPIAVPASRAGLRPHFERYAAEAGVPADLLMALGWQESGWQSGVVSSARAIGVMQLIPETVDFASRVLLRRSRPLDAFDPEQNIRMGAHHLAYLLRQTGRDTRTALAAWYQGLGAVRRHGPYDESLRFAANVQALRPRFR